MFRTDAAVRDALDLLHRAATRLYRAVLAGHRVAACDAETGLRDATAAFGTAHGHHPDALCPATGHLLGVSRG